MPSKPPSAELTLTLTDAPDLVAKDAALEQLYGHNKRATGQVDRRPIAVTAADPATGEVIGGLWGRTDLGLLFLELFYLPDSLRGQGVGRRMLEAVEAEAVRRGCQHAVVETSTFQAPGFYARHGYDEFGRIPFTGGHARVFLLKRLARAASEPASSDELATALPAGEG